MYAAERQQRILTEARREGRVEVAALAELLKVTPETVRRDLTALEGRGSLRRVHGGAIPVERLEVEPTLATRTSRLTEEKRRIAARAAAELPAEGTIILDAGSTTLALLDVIPRRARLTVITNSVAAASRLTTYPEITLYVLGGRIRGVTGAAVGQWAVSALADLTVDVAFLGTNGFSAARGLTTPDQSESLVKAAMVRAARRRILVTDATKSGDDHLHRFARISDLDVIITDSGLDEDVAAELKTLGPEVVLT
ncbi:MAG: DeoR/GlpR transcriptional regulator [Actinomycetales bacterium]|nr:DeoR/GlpR transcriptional regulator [Tetrasphaera sp.]NLW98668.1 DeoR/GlpR transcriptional regulator [Actinomycetales bacterium]